MLGSCNAPCRSLSPLHKTAYFVSSQAVDSAVADVKALTDAIEAAKQELQQAKGYLDYQKAVRQVGMYSSASLKHICGSSMWHLPCVTC